MAMTFLFRGRPAAHETRAADLHHWQKPVAVAKCDPVRNFNLANAELRRERMAHRSRMGTMGGPSRNSKQYERQGRCRIGMACRLRIAASLTGGVAVGQDGRIPDTVTANLRRPQLTIAENILDLLKRKRRSRLTAVDIAEILYWEDKTYRQRVKSDCLMLYEQGSLTRDGTGSVADPYTYGIARAG